MSAEQLAELARYIETHADQRLTLSELGARVQLTPTRLQKQFKQLLGVSPKAYQDAARLRLMKRALKIGERVTDAIYQAGFGSASRAYQPTRELGMVPKRYAKGGLGEAISYAATQTTLGVLVLAATDRGVCFAQFGSQRDDLLADLRAEFPLAQLSEAAASAELQSWLVALEQHLRLYAPSPVLPLDLRGSAFQIKVWRFLTGIDLGTTVSYGDVAKAIGHPAAVRAAASACARNRIAILVPCHRVLRGNGELGGYRWGLERKRRLLDAEAAELSRRESGR